MRTSHTSADLPIRAAPSSSSPAFMHWGHLEQSTYLAENVGELYERVGTRCFSMVVRSQFEGDKVTETEELWPAQVHP